jgi:mono/diheme cytochrome c family protein
MGCKKAEEPVEPPRSAEQAATQEKTGEELFNKHCIMCHREGSKIKNIREPADIAKVMRNPKGRMPEFNEAKIPDQEADEIAQFIFLSIIAHK